MFNSNSHFQPFPTLKRNAKNLIVHLSYLNTFCNLYNPNHEHYIIRCKKLYIFLTSAVSLILRHNNRITETESNYVFDFIDACGL